MGLSRQAEKNRKATPGGDTTANLVLVGLRMALPGKEKGHDETAWGKLEGRMTVHRQNRVLTFLSLGTPSF
jgi:hypothetical protein